MNFPAEYFHKQDNTPDEVFYSIPRKVVHIDDGAILLLKAYYGTVIPKEAIILDLMSSWRSHYPDDLQAKRVYGHGMNAEEMQDNPQLNEFMVQNLNKSQSLPYESNFFDAVTCAVSVQYMQKPLEVFREVQRILKPNGLFIVSFSNRCFPTKAVNVWLNTSDMQHVALVVGYFEKSDFAQISTEISRNGRSDPMYILSGRKPNG
jgi:hypothetical protein